MESNFTGPLNVGSEEMITINGLAELVMQIAGKTFSVRHINGPLGVRGRNSDNRLIGEKLSWRPSAQLREGLKPTYEWIAGQVEKQYPLLRQLREAAGPTPKHVSLAKRRLTRRRRDPSELFA